MKAKLGNEADMQCKPNEFLLQLSADGSKLQGMVYPTNTSRGPCSFFKLYSLVLYQTV